VCKDVFLAFIAQMKAQCSVGVNMFMTKLDRPFMDSKFMNAFNIYIHNFGINLMLISLSCCILFSSKDTIINWGRWNPQ